MKRGTLCAIVLMSLCACTGGNPGAQDGGDASDASGVISCRSDRACSANNQVCDAVQGVCVDCVVATDCVAPTPACVGNRCVAVTPCTSSRTCPGQVCSTTLGYCVDCVANIDCGGGRVCRNSVCDAPPRACMSSRMCSDIGQVCDTALGYCVQCATDVDCDSTQRCGPDHTCGARPPQTSCSDVSTPGCGAVSIPGGSFSMGEVGALSAEPLQTSVSVGAFLMDANEVTVARFRRYWLAGRPVPVGAIPYPAGSIAWSGAVTEPLSTLGCNWSAAPGARETHPINCVTWATALAFCVWDGGRLPTEAEWEFAARARPAAALSVPRRFPWGDEEPQGSPTLPCDRAQWAQCVGDDGGATKRVGSFAATAGLFDVAGNVYEWAADVYRDYSDTGCWGGASRTNPLCLAAGVSDFVIRGGSWRADMSTYLRGASRGHTTTPYPNIGFRCVSTR